MCHVCVTPVVGCGVTPVPCQCYLCLTTSTGTHLPSTQSVCICCSLSVCLVGWQSVCPCACLSAEAMSILSGLWPPMLTGSTAHAVEEISRCGTSVTPVAAASSQSGCIPPMWVCWWEGLLCGCAGGRGCYVGVLVGGAVMWVCWWEGLLCGRAGGFM